MSDDEARLSTRKRVTVPKTYKLYVGGSFARSESGRVVAVADADGAFRANAAKASRKDVRDAVAAARKAFDGWSGASAHNRGQVLFRVAEMLEGTRDRFTAEVAATEGLSATEAANAVDTAVDRMFWYAGWTDKLGVLRGGVDQVAGPYTVHSTPEPVGVVGVVAPRQSSLLGLVSVLAPVLVAGNCAVVLVDTELAVPAVSLCEALATSDVPGGVANVLTGDPAELVSRLASHSDVDALDPSGADESLRGELEETAAGSVKRVLDTPLVEPDWSTAPGTKRLRALTELKTVWHPIGE
ncbi:Aldehyde dehydrogenase family protein [Actinopolyspora mzabensis]|uniref:Aldehyde dehydrogenase family protein n=1 Tax=Actinopolyspora mzabensis TaxID=995066 RepID=A0A1G8VNC7_ACTMZ|nr:aldehyde dehydrogenase family protein [Actinopolyspora mzabensis]SDJ66905.1 Aldehyde dehydrogenase family protein [Actinopolyspora mzabensis]